MYGRLDPWERPSRLASYERMFVRPKRPYKAAEYAEARHLREEEGLPMKKIASRLGVSPGSVHLWTKDIKIAPEYAERNSRLCRDAARAAWTESNRRRRLAYQEEGRARSRSGDPLHQAGCMLYWAEGSKSRNSLVLANSDANLMRYFRHFLTRCFAIDPSRLAMSVNVYLNNGRTIDQVERYWLKALDLPQSCVRKHIVNHFPTSSSGRKTERLPYGTCHLKLHDTRIVQHIFGAIQEYGGFDEPRWLDGPARKPRRKPSPPAGTRAGPSGRGGGSRPGPRQPSGRRRGPTR